MANLDQPDINETAPPEPPMSADALRQQIKRLLLIAENSQTRCEQRMYKHLRLTFFGASISLGLVLAGVALMFIKEWESSIRYLLGGAFIFYGFMTGFFVFLLRLRLREDIRREQSTIYAVTDMLREMFQTLSSDPEVPQILLTEIRIRLSRLGIGPGKGYFDNHYYK